MVVAFQQRPTVLKVSKHCVDGTETFFLILQYNRQYVKFARLAHNPFWPSAAELHPQPANASCIGIVANLLSQFSACIFICRLILDLFGRVIESDKGIQRQHRIGKKCSSHFWRANFCITCHTHVPPAASFNSRSSFQLSALVSCLQARIFGSQSVKPAK